MGFFLSSRQEQNLATLHRFLASPRLEILAINQITAKLFGEIATELKLKGRPIQQDNLWIAALCKQYDYALATADQGFSAITGLEVISF